MATLRICFSVLLLVLGVFGQEECESTFPDGTDCSVDSTHVMEDLEDCSSFWKCSNDDCPKKTKCERNYLFNTQTKTCTSNTMVDCGERPCLDPMHCPSEHPTTTPTPETTTNTCDHSFDCVAAGDGWFADEFNCRKYWHCFGGVGDHSICPQGQLFDPVHVWCDWADRVECGDRPICGVCDDDCETTTSHKPTTWGPTTTQGSCKHVCKEDGLFSEGCCENTFCQCFGGIGYVQHCETNLVFNDVTHTCDFQFNVPCCNAHFLKSYILKK